jgi:hypothetical protein
MTRLKAGCLALAVAVFCAGCIVNATPVPPTAALVTATMPATADSPASATAIAILTSTATATAPPTDTPAPALASSTPPASLTSAVTPTDAPAPTASSAPTLPPVPTQPPQATALPVGIISFGIAPQQINPGDSVTLTWQAIGEQATIYRLEPGGPLTDMYNVPLSGTLTLKTPDGLRNEVQYVLYAGAGGSTASATVSAIITCPDKWFFANPPAGCPGGPGNLVAMAGEHFEHGLMLWLSSQDRIYILFGDGGSPQWSAVANQWVQGQPESDPTLTPPAGLFQPVRGFGMAWRSIDPSLGPIVRDRLGWATEPESAMTGGYQCDSAPKYNHCYISGPGGVIYHLKPEFSGWEVWQGP